MLIKLVIFPNLCVVSNLHYCSLHRNAQYGLMPFRLLKLRIDAFTVVPPVPPSETMRQREAGSSIGNSGSGAVLFWR